MKGPDQSAGKGRLICAFVVRKPQKIQAMSTDNQTFWKGGSWMGDTLFAVV